MLLSAPICKRLEGGSPLPIRRSGRYFARQTMDAYNAQLDEAGSDSSNHVGLLSIKHIEFGEGEHIPRINSTVDGTDVFLFTAPYDPGYAHAQAVSLFASLEAHGFIAPGKTLDEFLDNHPKKDGVPPPIKVFGDAVRTKLLNGNMHETYNTVRTLADNGATVTVVMPYHAYGRQNKPTRLKREAAIARLVADLLVESGAAGMITFDPHAEDIAGFYPTGHFVKKFIGADKSIYDLFSDHAGREDTAIIYLDNGCFQRYNKLASQLGLKEIFVSKYRDGEADVFNIAGWSPGITRGVVADDIFATGGTYQKVLTRLFEMGMREFYGYVSHGLFTKNAMEILVQLNDLDGRGYGLRQLSFTNGTPQSPAVLALPFIDEIGLQNPLSKTINSVHYRTSTSQHFVLPE
jgi:ribose-phosphate pyrophosphokinase